MGSSAEALIAALAIIGIVIVVSALLSGVIERRGLPQVAVFLAIGSHRSLTYRERLTQSVIKLHTKPQMTVDKWIRRLGVWGFLFFLIKGLLWLTIPALIAFLATS